MTRHDLWDEFWSAEAYQPASHEFRNVNAKFRDHICNDAAILCVVARLGGRKDLRQAVSIDSMHRRMTSVPESVSGENFEQQSLPLLAQKRYINR